jgi:hypothetical protein
MPSWCSWSATVAGDATKVETDIFHRQQVIYDSVQQQLNQSTPPSQHYLSDNQFASIFSQQQIWQANLQSTGTSNTRGGAAQLHPPQLQHAQHLLQQPDQLLPTAALANISYYSGSLDSSSIRSSVMNGSQQFAGHNLRPRTGRPFAATAAATAAVAAPTPFPTPAHPTAAAAAAAADAAAAAAAAATAAAVSMQRPLPYAANAGARLAPAVARRAGLDACEDDDDDDDYDSCSSPDMSISSRQQVRHQAGHIPAHLSAFSPFRHSYTCAGSS